VTAVELRLPPPKKSCFSERDEAVIRCGCEIRMLTLLRTTKPEPEAATSITMEPKKMLLAEYCRLMARYNTWQNASLVTAADGLTNVDRWKDRGAFFQSIAATLNHIYWADALMLQRLKGNERPEETIKHSLTSPSGWDDFKTLRLQRDEEIEEWAARLLDADLNGMIVWYPGDGSTRIEKPKALCAIELFNHQTHHRGQIHAMLTAAGAEPEPTDLSMLP
jgi:uncharacterized damage-inducible protein DinB